jgi:hypothetical protein
MEEKFELNFVKIDCKAPVFNMPVYDPIKDEDLTINLESLA